MSCLKKLIFSLIVISILLGGCFVKKEDYDEETITKAEAVAESYLRSNYKDIETIEIEKVYTGQLGGLEVRGTANNKYRFNLTVGESNFTIMGISEGENFPERKEECKVKSCDY